MTKLSIVTAAYNEAANLPHLRERLMAVLESLDMDWEWIVVDDHSLDDTPAVLQRFADEDPRVKLIRLARNHGSHVALLCGFRHAAGDIAVLQTADLQDPPEQITSLIEPWRNGAQVVWATRTKGRSDPTVSMLWARLYYVIMRRLLGMREIPQSGGDMVLLDRCVLDTLAQINESNLNLLVTISWLGFRQAHVEGERQTRLHGRSSYNFSKKLKLFIDTVTYFSFRPIRWISYLGVLLSFLGFAYAAFIVVNRFLYGTVSPGWSSIMVTVLVLNGLQMILLGITGEYLWRALEQGRHRPLFVIEQARGFRSSRDVGPGPHAATDGETKRKPADPDTTQGSERS